MIETARRGWWVAVPALLGLLALAAIGEGPIVYLRGPLGLLLALAGVVASLGLAVLWAGHERLRRAKRAAAAEAAAAAADRRRLLMRLNHELKHPLTAVQLGLTSFAHRSEPGAQATRLGRLVTELRTLEELEPCEVEPAPVDLEAILREIVATVGERPDARRLRLKLPELPWVLPEVRGDGDLLFLALHTLVVNALTFSGAGDAVEIRAAEEGPYVHVEVADTGPGIPAEQLDEVCPQPARGPAVRAVSGTRLGQPLVRTIFSRDGGDAHIRSSVGHGTVVSVRLPTSRDYVGV